ncbi:MAG TPA: DUF1456 domain-containing protein [Spirochaetia bacterium]|nr:MAG: hypothetical protein A2Y41_07645 [Spirochaetes bacterium GWB1_36_13]HCL57974.1 DUF1456 domain-containing protein [Spirochaetia bacterium]
MKNNDILKRFRYALDLKDAKMLHCFSLGGYQLTEFELADYFKKEEDEEFLECPAKALEAFLDGLIIEKRGKKEEGAKPVQKTELTNNIVLKKIRIALELKEEEMLQIMKLSGFPISKPELSAFFRNKDHRNYKECKDQFLRNFLKGLSLFYR